MRSSKTLGIFSTESSFRCVIDFPAITLTIPPEIVFTYYAFLLGFLFPASMITTFYVLVLIRLHRIRQKHRSELKQRSHRKVTRVVLAVITVYFICWVPYWFLQIFITIDPLVHSLRLNFSVLPANTNMRFLKELTHLTTIIGYANNCLNPLLYVFLSDSFREEYLVVLKCFHPEGLFQDQSLHYGQFQAREITSTKILRKSMKQRQRRAQAMKKVKHSVAIDEGPSEHRTFSFRFHRTSHQRRYSSTTGRLSGQDKNQLELASFPRASAQFLFAQHSAGRMIDDGGVYCGD